MLINGIYILCFFKHTYVTIRDRSCKGKSKIVPVVN